jgi:hypothetical protein
MSEESGQAAELNEDHGDIDPRFGAGLCGLIIAGQSPLAHQPAEGAFHDPAAWQDFEASGVIGASDDLDCQLGTQPLDPAGERFTGVATIHPQDAQPKYQWFELCADVLDFTSKAKPSTNSFLGHDYFMDLPASILVGSMSGEQEEQLDHDKLVGLRLKDYTKTGQTLHLTHIKHKDGALTFSDSVNDYDYLVRELARGDFDGDGNEDALIEVAWHTQGTLGGSFTEIVTRTRPDRDPKWVATDQFLKCTPNIVKLVGTILNETFPGQPNYKDIKKGDEIEKCWILKLSEPIDVAEDPEYPAPDENSPQLNVRDVQLNLDVHLNADYKAYQQFLDKRVVVTGELTQGFTVHHKTAIMMWVRDIKAVE